MLITNGLASTGTAGWTGCSDARVYVASFHASTWAHITLNVTNIEKRGRGGECPAGARRKRRRQRGEAAEGEK
jgi:hypothetical protein